VAWTKELLLCKSGSPLRQTATQRLLHKTPLLWLQSRPCHSPGRELWQLVGIFSAYFDISRMGFSLTVILVGYNEIKLLSQGRSPRDACRAAEIFPLSCLHPQSLSGNRFGRNLQPPTALLQRRVLSTIISLLSRTTQDRGTNLSPQRFCLS
jgi:hypothetical protein